MSTAEQIMAAAANLYINGQHLSVGGIETKSGISRVTISKIFKDERGTPTVKVIEDRMIASVLGETRAAIFDYLRHQDPVVAENPLYQLIAVCRAIFHVFNANNPMGRFVAHRLTDLQGNETLALMFSRVDEMLLAAQAKGLLEAHVAPDIRRLRLILFGILRGLLTLLPAGSTSGGGTPELIQSTRVEKYGKGKRQAEPVTAQHIEVEFLRIIRLHVSDSYKGHVDKYIEVASKA
jgi:hypothetical protein